MIGLRRIIGGSHTGDYGGVPATGLTIQTSASHFFRVRDDRLVEHWQVIDTYRILTKIGRISGVGAQFQKMLGMPEAPDGIFVQGLGTPFDAPRNGRRITHEESRAVSRCLYDGAITTGVGTDVDALADNYIQHSGWTPDGREYFGQVWAIGRGAVRDGLAIQPTSWPKMTVSHRSVEGTAPSPLAAKPSTSPRPTSCGSKTASPPNTGTPPTMSGCTKRSARSPNLCDHRRLTKRLN
jgi:predicted SnoaL-like aldol condensation-catalyzing enzyme